MLRRLVVARVMSIGAACVVGALVASGLAAGSHQATVKKVTVTVTDTSVKLSTKKLTAGKVTFAVVNRGKKSHVFSVAGKKTKALAAGKKTTLVVTLKAGKVTYFATSPKKSGVLVVSKAAPAKKTTPTKPSAGGSSAAVAAGETVFKTAGCASCHTLKTAGASGTIGPNLDQVKPSKATVVQFVTNGYNGVGAPVPMPSFQGTLSSTQIQDVATFVSTATH